MDRSLLKRHLVQAERHVAQGEKHVEDQRARVAMLDLDRHDVTYARALLAQFEQMLAVHTADRDRIRRELADMRDG